MDRFLSDIEDALIELEWAANNNCLVAGRVGPTLDPYPEYGVVIFRPNFLFVSCLNRFAVSEKELGCAFGQ